MKGTKPKRRVRVPECRRCCFYYVTWKPERPHGCRALQFVSPRPPSLVVLEASGVACRQFVEKPRPEIKPGSSR